MSVETADDLASFFDSDDFAEPASYTKQGSSAISIDVIVDRRTEIAHGGGVIPAAQRVTMLTCRESDLPTGSGNGDAVTVRSIDYTVRSVEPDGTGVAAIRCERA